MTSVDWVAVGVGGVLLVDLSILWLGYRLEQYRQRQLKGWWQAQGGDVSDWRRYDASDRASRRRRGQPTTAEMTNVVDDWDKRTWPR